MPECLQFAFLNSALTCYKLSTRPLDAAAGTWFN